MKDTYVNDILQEIPNEHLPQLAKIYENYKKEYPYVYSTIKIGIRWKNLNPNDNRVLFLSPHSCWKQDGTFIAIFTFTTEVEITLFTLEESAKKLCDGIRYTHRKQFDQNVSFYSTHDKLTPLVRNACEDRHMKITLWINSIMVRLPIEVALNYEINCPPEVYLKPLEIRDVPQINSVWPRKYDGSEIRLANLIEMNGGIGAYLKDNDKLVAWIICDQMGQISALQTHDDHKKRGYASLVTKALSKKLANDGIYPFAGINVKNIASLKMFAKIGYEQIGPHTYFHMAPMPKSKI